MQSWSSISLTRDGQYQLTTIESNKAITSRNTSKGAGKHSWIFIVIIMHLSAIRTRKYS
jgi:hypothetical protein